MKKSLFLAAMAAVVLSGCSKNETNEIANGSSPIEFGGAYVGISRAVGIVDNVYPENSSFMVLGYYTAQETLAAAADPALNFMREVVTKKTSGYEYNTKYWPATLNDKITFFAVHPSTATITPGTVGTESKALPSVDFDVNATIKDQVDLMGAVVKDQTKTSSAIKFTFGHALTKVGFAAKLAGTYPGATVTVTGVKIVGEISKGGVYAAANTGAWAWTPKAATANTTYEPTVTTPVELNSTDFQVVNDADQFLLMVPQGFAAGKAELVVNYKVEQTDGLTFTNEVKTDLNTLTPAWTANSFVTYQMLVSLEAIKFDADVTPWTASPVGGN